MLDVEPTPPATLTRARDDRARATACATRTPATCTTPTAAARAARGCGDVRRSSATGTTSARYRLTDDGRCRACGDRAPGPLRRPAGSWGARRMPVRIAGARAASARRAARATGRRVAGLFYPGDAGDARARRSTTCSRRRAPPWSGPVPEGAHRAARRLRVLRPDRRRPGTRRSRAARDTIRRVVVARARALRAASTASRVSSADAFATPLGDVPIDRELRASCARAPRRASSTTRPHAARAQPRGAPAVPAARRSPTFTLLPLVVGRRAGRRVADRARRRLGRARHARRREHRPQPLPRPRRGGAARPRHGRRRDRQRRRSTPSRPTTRAARTRCAACSPRPHAAASRVELLDLRNSGDTAGSRDRVVGYAAFAVLPAPTSLGRYAVP